ncbi:amidohydrolase family protein, partial [Algiphilus sp.]|uniref:amidohydrolase family protein n=1 Tax=Algiphilus sp. TaxID=1872431 RepID=UPI003C6AFDF5
GVTAVTDCSHDNDRDDVAAFGAAQRSGALLQDVLVMGNADLDGAGVPADGDDGPELAIGARKFHLHDAALPDLDELTAAMRAAHAAGRNVAAHCVSRVDLAFALAAWRAAGARPGDRVEHASVAPPEALAEIAALGLTVVSQPAMISERGAVYRREVDADDLPHLYRLRSFQVAGVPLALSSDAPYTDIDPWRAMAAAVTRRCADGEPLGPDEALSPERAYAAMAGRPSGPGRGDLRLRAGMRADLCLLDRDWAAARADLGCVRPRRAWRAGADNYHLNGVGHGAPACAP